MLAIFGAFALINRTLGDFFEIFVMLSPAVLIIVYATMHNFSDGIYLAIGLLIISFIICGADIMYIVYVPISVFSGVIYSLAVKKNCNKKILLLISVASYVIGELLAFFVFFPIIDPAFNQAANEELLTMLNQFFNLGVNVPTKVITLAFIIGYIFMGISEGIMIHFFSVILFVKLKIKTLSDVSIFTVKPNKIISYVSMLIIIASLVLSNFNIINIDDNYALYVVLTILSLISIIVLWFYGYIYIVLYIRTVLKVKVSPLILFLLIMTGSILFVIIGFLYGAGPLESVLERKARNNE